VNHRYRFIRAVKDDLDPTPARSRHVSDSCHSSPGVVADV